MRDSVKVEELTVQLITELPRMRFISERSNAETAKKEGNTALIEKES